MKIILFGMLSVPLLFLSRSTLFSLKNHGLYRFVAWECILWIALQNQSYLIVEKFDLQQLTSSALMIASLAYVISALRTMRKKGKASRQRRDETLLGFEKTTVLIETGIYRYIRHPMYSSLLFLVWGLLLRNIEITLLIVTLIASFFCLLAAKIEENENIAYFGECYIRYMQRTKMIIPHIV